MLLLGAQGIARDVPCIHHWQQTPCPSALGSRRGSPLPVPPQPRRVRRGVELVSTDATLPSAPGVASGQEESTIYGRSWTPFGLPHPIQRSWRD